MPFVAPVTLPECVPFYGAQGRALGALRFVTGVPFAVVSGVAAPPLRGVPFSVPAAVGPIAVSGDAVAGVMAPSSSSWRTFGTGVERTTPAAGEGSGRVGLLPSSRRDGSQTEVPFGGDAIEGREGRAPWSSPSTRNRRVSRVAGLCRIAWRLRCGGRRWWTRVSGGRNGLVGIVNLAVGTAGACGRTVGGSTPAAMRSEGLMRPSMYTARSTADVALRQRFQRLPHPGVEHRGSKLLRHARRRVAGAAQPVGDGRLVEALLPVALLDVLLHRRPPATLDARQALLRVRQNLAQTSLGGVPQEQLLGRGGGLLPAQLAVVVFQTDHGHPAVLTKAIPGREGDLEAQRDPGLRVRGGWSTRPTAASSTCSCRAAPTSRTAWGPTARSSTCRSATA
ncbi:MAG: hypothetical protein EPO40_25005 [Myxococcaceae bacterium]|nr:MAG: hypothetical protein EPO40_25005 [Myxococcaceae bacterium]